MLHQAVQLIHCLRLVRLRVRDKGAISDHLALRFKKRILPLHHTRAIVEVVPGRAAFHHTAAVVAVEETLMIVGDELNRAFPVLAVPRPADSADLAHAVLLTLLDWHNFAGAPDD